MSDRTLRVLTLNIGSLFEPRWEERREVIAAGLDDLAPDIVCFQEVCESTDRPNTAEWIAERASETWHTAFGGFPFERDEPGLRFGSAVLSRFPIESSGLHRLPLADDPESMLTEIGWELLHAQTAGLDVYSTHLAPAPHHGPHRLRQVVAIDDLIRATRAERGLDRLGTSRDAMPPILCGDFNAEPDSDEIRFLTSLAPVGERSTFYQDSWRIAGDGSAGFTNDWANNELAGLLNVHRKRIDYVFVGDPFLRPASGGRVLTSAVVLNDPTALASDHFGVMADIVWPTRPDRPATR